MKRKECHMNSFYLITFKNTHDAISTEGVLKRSSISHLVVPTPTSITGSCGISIKINEAEFEKVSQLIFSKEINVKAIFLKDDSGYRAV
jgi:hypothetical protein